jgi:hypothetical protein
LVGTAIQPRPHCHQLQGQRGERDRQRGRRTGRRRACQGGQQDDDGQHHTEPDEDNRDCYGPRETHVAGLLRRIMVFISLVEDSLGDAEGGVGVRHTAVNSGLQQHFFDLFPR